MGEPLIARLDLLIRHDEDELRKIAGDSSLCAISRTGKPVPAIKYQEGRTTALRDLRRRIKSGSDWSAAVAEVSQGLSSQASLAARSADWSAYVEGGRDALAEFDI